MVLLSGADEARLTYRGVLHGCPDLAGRRILCVDVGGGSTELLVGEGGRPLLVASVPWGSLRVVHRLLGREPWSTSTLRRARVRLAADFDAGMRAMRTAGFEHAVATSGTAQRLVRLNRGSTHGNVDGERLDRAALARLCDRLLRAPRDLRVRLPGMDPERGDSLVGGALIFEALTRGLGVASWRLSTAALRTGLVLDGWTHSQRV